MPQLFGLARIGRDAEVRYSPKGDAVVNLSLAFNYQGKGERETQWVDGSLWGKRAEALAPYLLKGGAVAVTLGDVHIETYEGKNGAGHKLVGRVVEIELGGKGSGEDAPKPAKTPAAAPKVASMKGTGFDDMEDDIPF
jgi:single-strand DNA-binding protein